MNALKLALLSSLSLAAACGTCSSPSAHSAADVPLSETITAPANITVTSTDFTPNGALADTYVFSGFGCSGGNESPALSWTGAPEGTRSFAIVVHDPDAPTGVGFFHWIAYDIPSTTTSLARNAATTLPEGTRSGHTDFGTQTYGGPCPPPGPAHRYIFTVYALDVPTLGLDAGASGAVTRFMLRQHTIGYGRLIGTYAR
jgi:Raf kinase inhibitor-like YbhB/YbcL family protein